MRDQEEEFRKTFRIYDEDDSGIITAENLVAVGKNLGENLTEDDAQGMIQFGDKNCKGGVDIEEFVEMMKVVGLIPMDYSQKLEMLGLNEAELKQLKKTPVKKR